MQDKEASQTQDLSGGTTIRGVTGAVKNEHRSRDQISEHAETSPRGVMMTRFKEATEHDVKLTSMIHDTVATSEIQKPFTFTTNDDLNVATAVNDPTRKSTNHSKHRRWQSLYRDGIVETPKSPLASQKSTNYSNHRRWQSLYRDGIVETPKSPLVDNTTKHLPSFHGLSLKESDQHDVNQSIQTEEMIKMKAEISSTNLDSETGMSQTHREQTETKTPEIHPLQQRRENSGKGYPKLHRRWYSLQKEQLMKTKNEEENSHS